MSPLLNLNKRALRKLDEASYPWRNNKTRGNRRRTSYWNREMKYQSGLACGMSKANSRKEFE